MKWKNRSTYFKTGFTAFVVIAACILFYFLIFRADQVGAGLTIFFNVLNPIIYGFVIAYILNPFFQLIENIFLKIVSRTRWVPKKLGRKVIRIVCAFLSAAICIFVIYALIAQMIPELVKSIKNIIINYNTYVTNIQTWISSTFSDKNLDSQTSHVVSDISSKIGTWLQETFQPQMDTFATHITTSVRSALAFLKNAFLGFIISIYIIIEKDYIKARFNRLVFAIWPIHTGSRIVRNLQFVDEKFGGFLIGKIIDSAIIGVMCYIGTMLLHMPYALLVSVIVGITNIIPFFGPFIGAIPSAFLIFAVDPWKALIFCIFILALQQFDGNYLGPKILGGSVGVSSFLVLISIIIGGGLFGVVGMIIGVPVCAIIVSIIQSFIIKQDDKKQIPGDLAPYVNLGRINPSVRAVEEKKPVADKMSLYDRIKYRSEDVRKFDYPLEDRPWDWNKEKVDEYESVRETDRREEEESAEKIRAVQEEKKRKKEEEAKNRKSS